MWKEIGDVCKTCDSEHSECSNCTARTLACTACNTTWGLNSSGECTECSTLATHCRTCINNSGTMECNGCNLTYAWAKNLVPQYLCKKICSVAGTKWRKSTNTCHSCASQAENCITCEDETLICQACNPTHYVKPADEINIYGSCVHCDTFDTNCYTCSWNAGNPSCSVCKTDY